MVLEGAPENGTLALNADQELTEGDTRGKLVSLTAPSGTYDESSVSISDGNTTDIGMLGSLTIASDPDKGYEGSLAGSASTDGQGSFAVPVTARTET